MLHRRQFMVGAGAAAGMAGLTAIDALAMGNDEAVAGLQTESRRAYRELLELLTQADAEYLSATNRISTPGDISDGHRYIMHALSGGLDLFFEADPDYPVFRRIVTPWRKANGDNPDAIYYMAAVRGDRRYRVEGNLADATYTSITIEAGGEDGTHPQRTEGIINDLTIETDEEGRFELLIGPDVEGPNTLRMPPDAVRLTTRHYFERERSVASILGMEVPLRIEALDVTGPRPDFDDARIAAGIRRVANRVRGFTTASPANDPSQSPAWVSRVPNQFNAPEKPGSLASAAIDAAYAMAPYLLKPDEALVIEGRFPECRFANVVLWNRYLQSYDYVYRQISRNRAQTTLEEDGSFRMVLAHRDPGVPNWMDTMGRPFGMVYWRFVLPEGEVVTPKASVVPFESLASG